MNRIIGIDVDLTVCPSDRGWWKWLYEKSLSQSDTFPYFDQCTVEAPFKYNLAEYYENKDSAFDYWRTLEYSQFEPLQGSVEKLEQLSKYFDIVFISAIKGLHNKEKYYWLKKHFPEMKGYIATKEKFLMNDSVVAMTDDRLDNLQGFDHHKRVLYKTPYEQYVECSVGYTIESWESLDVKDFCEYLWE
ncbi:MAG: hypothetical protein EOO06_01060 [Chitinophagaceae bacterium]|nr:MAG: hypothetical protein EOO06_01060 [Chitinophagaceae bacterium]